MRELANSAKGRVVPLVLHLSHGGDGRPESTVEVPVEVRGDNKLIDMTISASSASRLVEFCLKAGFGPRPAV